MKRKKIMIVVQIMVVHVDHVLGMLSRPIHVQQKKEVQFQILHHQFQSDRGKKFYKMWLVLDLKETKKKEE